MQVNAGKAMGIRVPTGCATNRQTETGPWAAPLRLDQEPRDRHASSEASHRMPFLLWALYFKSAKSMTIERGSTRQSEPSWCGPVPKS